MKRQTFMLLLVSAAFVACQEDEIFGEGTTDGQYTILNASTANEESRTVVHENSNNTISFYWENSDQLSVWLNNSTNSKGTLISHSGTSAEVATSGTTGTGSSPGAIIALYPYTSGATVSTTGGNSVVTVDFPNTQTAVNGSTARNIPMVAATTGPSDKNLHFKNVASWIRFSLTSATSVKVSKIVLESKERDIAGSVNIVAKSGVAPTATVTSNGKKSITLDCGNMTVGSMPVVLYLSLLPCTLETGKWSIKIYDSDNKNTSYDNLPNMVFKRNEYTNCTLQINPPK